MTTEPEHTNSVPGLTISLSTADAQALGDDVGQLAMRLGSVLHGLAQLRAGGASTEDLANTILVSNGLLNRAGGRPGRRRTPARRTGRLVRRAGGLHGPAATLC